MADMTNPIPNPHFDAVGPVSQEERTWAVAGHLAALVAAVVSAGWLCFVGPLVIWALYKDRSAFVRRAAAGAFNFNLVLWVMILVGWLLFFTVIGIPFAILLWLVAGVAGLVFHVLAAVRTNRGESYTYPWQIRVLS